MAELCEEYGERAFVLFPSAEALPAEEVAQARSAEKRAAGSSAGAPKSYLFVAVDGTWKQARRMAALIPSSARHVALSPATLSEFCLRRQSQEGRICTVEAVSLLLQELDEREASQALTDALWVLHEAVSQQGHREGQPEVADGKGHKLAKPNPVSKSLTNREGKPLKAEAIRTPSAGRTSRAVALSLGLGLAIAFLLFRARRR